MKRTQYGGKYEQFPFTDKSKLEHIPECGELVRWMQQEGMQYKEISLAGTKEFGLLEEYEKQGQERCRPFNRIRIDGNVLVKEAVDEQGKKLAKRECAWYEEVRRMASWGKETGSLPQIYGMNPLRMEYIKGSTIYNYTLNYQEKLKILKKLVTALQELHHLGTIQADTFSMKEAYYKKTMERLSKIEDLVPFAREKEIVINGKRCRNVYFYKRKLEKRLEELTCDRFCFIHGDCTFSNLMLRENGNPVLIDPRGYFSDTKLYGDVRYDWAKLYYSIVGNYDRFNLKEFRLEISEHEVQLKIASNHWEDMEKDFFALTGAKEWEIRLLHAIIWLSLTTYAWSDYDSVCGAFYNGLFYLEDVL